MTVINIVEQNIREGPFLKLYVQAVFFWIYLARKTLICQRTSGELWRDTSDLIISQVLAIFFCPGLKMKQSKRYFVI
jgi:hypothetical protein